MKAKMKSSKVALHYLATFALAGCGSQSPNDPVPMPAPVHVAPVAEEARLPPVGVVATNDVASHVRITWQAPRRGGVTGYRVLREGGEIARVGADSLAFDDATAAPATLSAPTVQASDATTRDGIRVTWIPSSEKGMPASYAYSVVALYGSAESGPSDSKRGSRPGAVTSYEIERADGRVFTVETKDGLEYGDVDAPRVPVTFVPPLVVADGLRSIVQLSFNVNPILGRAPAAQYRVRARSAAGLGAYSALVTGRRGAGEPNEIAIQWQRSASTTDGTYADLVGVTGREWFDSTAPDATRYFRARVESSWATGVSASASAKNVHWKAIDRSVDHVCAIDAAEERLTCWDYGSYPTLTVSSRSADAVERFALGPWRSHCAIRKSDHRAQCERLPGTPPTDPLVDIVVLEFSACGLREVDRKMVCWGNRTIGALGEGGFEEGPSATAYKRLFASARFPCAERLSDGVTECFGDERGRPLLPAGGPFLALALPEYPYRTVCGIVAATGLVACSDDLVPTLPNVAFKELVFRREYEYCGVRASDDGISCGTYGLMPGPGKFRSLSHGPRSSLCAIDEGGRIRCWSSYDEGTGIMPEPSFVSAAFDQSRWCGVRAVDRRVECHGDDLYRTHIALPDARYTSIAGFPSAGALCGIREGTGQLECRVGSGASVQSPPAGAFVSLAVGAHLACALRADGTLACWGRDAPASTAGTYESVFVSDDKACAIRTVDSKVQCWGSPWPTSQPPDVAVTALSFDSSFGCAIRKSDQRRVCWGAENASAPTAPSTEKYASLSTGAFAPCGIEAGSNTLRCWGSGALSEPMQDRLSSWGGFGCGLRATDGKVVCLGRGHVPLR